MFFFHKTNWPRILWLTSLNIFANCFVFAKMFEFYVRKTRLRAVLYWLCTMLVRSESLMSCSIKLEKHFLGPSFDSTFRLHAMLVSPESDSMQCKSALSFLQILSTPHSFCVFFWPRSIIWGFRVSASGIYSICSYSIHFQPLICHPSKC